MELSLIVVPSNRTLDDEDDFDLDGEELVQL